MYQGQEITEIPDHYVGFVYMIINTLTGRRYLGKKLSKFSRTSYKTVRLKNGRKKRKKIRRKIDSDWRHYYGSSPELTRDVQRLGPANFAREILFFCRSKSECSYVEAREQFNHRVLESNDWYNGHIRVRVHGSHIRGKL